jgi:tetratricopeptide (TPR) repeat protein
MESALRLILLTGLPPSMSEHPVLVKRFKRLALVAAFLLALLWSLGSFFIWILTGITAYFIFLAVYYSPRKPIAFNNRSTKRAEETSRANATGKSAQSLSPQQKRQVVFIIVGISAVIILVSFVLAIIGLVRSDVPNSMNDEDRQTLVTDPTNVEALTNIGNKFYADQQYDSAFYYYNRVLEADPQNSSGLYNKALIHYQKQEYDQSIIILKQCNTLYPDYVEVYSLLGDNYYLQDKYPEALPWYRKAYDKGVNNAEVLNILGYLYEQQSNKTEAVRFYKETLQQDSSLIDVYDRLAELEPGNGRRYKALSERWK